VSGGFRVREARRRTTRGLDPRVDAVPSWRRDAYADGAGPQSVPDKAALRL